MKSRENEPTKVAATIGSADKNGKQLRAGDIVRYMAGSRRQIEHFYLTTNRPDPDIFQLIDKYNHYRLDNFHVRIFEFASWGEIIGRMEGYEQ